MPKESLNAARKALFLEKRAESALEILSSLMKNHLRDMTYGEQRATAELMGLAYEEQRCYDEASKVFTYAGNYYQSGYCQMLKGSLDKAVAQWQNLLPERPNHWCLTLHGLVSGNLNSVPTFLQIRNHIEADIIHLWRAGQTLMAENIIRYVDMLADINYEVYKFAGRALFHVGQLDKASYFLLRGHKILPNDPEIYYHLGQYYHALGRDEEAAIMLHQCILISPSYFPAKELHTLIHGDNSSCRLG